MFRRHISNILGKTTNRHLLAFFIDDYGAVINDSSESQKKIASLGYDLTKNRFTQFDALETDDDIDGLFEVLSSFTDINGNNAVWTPLAVPANPDFENIKKCNFEEYFFKTNDDIYPLSNNRQHVYDLIKEGIRKRIFVPQFHGREHINVRMLMNALKEQKPEAYLPFMNNSLYTFRTNDGKFSSSMAFKFYDINDLNSYDTIIKEGLNAFEHVYGYRAIHFNAPGERENSVIDKYLFNNGIKYIETDKIKRNPIGNGQSRIQIHWNGQMNNYNQRYIIRNCVFEPTADIGVDWVDYTFRQIEIAFKWKKPAIVSGHRVNFAGGISEKNRQIGLKALSMLLKKVTDKYNDIEFVSSEDLFKIMYGG